MIWAIETDIGYVIRHTEAHPAECGHADECDGRKVVELSREPTFYEYVDFSDGSLKAPSEKGIELIISMLKQKASDEIERIAPVWRQLNDLADPTSESAVVRRAHINIIRGWSNKAESYLRSSTTAEQVEEVLDTIRTFTI